MPVPVTVRELIPQPAAATITATATATNCGTVTAYRVSPGISKRTFGITWAPRVERSGPAGSQHVIEVRIFGEERNP